MADSDHTADDYMALVGNVLTQWGQVEYAHATLFQTAASGVINNTALWRAYWSVVSFEGRQKMVDAALREAFGDHSEYLATWNNLNNRLIQKNQVRNKIAHGSVVRWGRGDGTVTPIFVPFFFAKMHENLDENGRFANKLTVNEFNAIQMSFLELFRDLNALQRRYHSEQIETRQITQTDGSTILPRFHRAKSPYPIT
jgi:hypothetical protein